MSLRIPLACVTVIALTWAACAPAPTPAPALPPPPELPDLTELDPPVREQFERAHQNLSRILADERAGDRHRAEAYGELGRIYHAYSHHAVAAELYRAAHQLEPQEARWPHLLGLAERQEGRWQASADAFRAALKLRPDHPALHVYLGENLLDRHDLEPAGNYFRAALAIDERCERARLGLGRVALEQGRAEEAIEWLEGARADSESTAIRYSLAMAYRQAGQIEKAEQLLADVGTNHLTRSALILVDPVASKIQNLRRDATYFEHRALKAIARKDFRRAVNDLRHTMTIDPERIEARVNLALALLRLDLRQEAESHLNQALETDPNYLPALKTLAELLQRTGRADEAAPLLQRAAAVEAERSPSNRADIDAGANP